MVTRTVKEIKGYGDSDWRSASMRRKDFSRHEIELIIQK